MGREEWEGERKKGGRGKGKEEPPEDNSKKKKYIVRSFFLGCNVQVMKLKDKRNENEKKN